MLPHSLCTVQRGCTDHLPPCTAPPGAFPAPLHADSSLTLISAHPMHLCVGGEVYHTPMLTFKGRAQSLPPPQHLIP